MSHTWHFCTRWHCVSTPLPIIYHKHTWAHNLFGTPCAESSFDSLCLCYNKVKHHQQKRFKGDKAQHKLYIWVSRTAKQTTSVWLLWLFIIITAFAVDCFCPPYSVVTLSIYQTWKSSMHKNLRSNCGQSNNERSLKCHTNYNLQSSAILTGNINFSSGSKEMTGSIAHFQQAGHTLLLAQSLLKQNALNLQKTSKLSMIVITLPISQEVICI